MMEYRVDHKLTATTLALFFLFISKGAVATGDEGGAVDVKKTEVGSVAEKSKGAKLSKPSRWSLLKKKVVGSSSNVRTMGQFDKSGDIKSFEGAVDKLSKYIKDEFGKTADTRTQKRDENEVFRAVLKVSSTVGHDKFDTTAHYDAALELANVALENKAKFKNSKMVVKITKLQERLKEEKSDPSKRELRIKKASDQKARSFVNKLKKGVASKKDKKDKKALKGKKDKKSKGTSRRVRKSRAPKLPLTPEEKKQVEREKAIAKELSALKKTAKKAKGDEKKTIAEKQKKLKAELKASQDARKKAKKEATGKLRSAKKEEKKKVKEEKKALKEEKGKLEEEGKKAVTPEEKEKIEKTKKELEEKSKKLKEEKKRSKEERKRSKKGERSKKGKDEKPSTKEHQEAPVAA